MGKKVKKAFSSITSPLASAVQSATQAVGLSQKIPEAPKINIPAPDTSAMQASAAAQEAAARAAQESAAAAQEAAQRQADVTARAQQEQAAREQAAQAQAAEQQRAADAEAARVAAVRKAEEERTRDLSEAEVAERQAEASGAVGLVAPKYAGVSQEMTPLQKRTAIATRGVSGDLGTDPEAFKYFRNQSFASLGGGGEPTPIERKYVESFGEKLSSNSPLAYLSAIERIFRRF